MNDENIEKINIKIQHFSQFEELQVLGPNLPETNMNDKKFEKINNKIYLYTKFQSI